MRAILIIPIVLAPHFSWGCDLGQFQRTINHQPMFNGLACKIIYCDDQNGKQSCYPVGIQPNPCASTTPQQTCVTP